MDKCSVKGWLYLLPAIAFLGVFMVYPLVDVFVYSFEEGYNSASQTFSGVGLFNYRYVLRDPYFLQALKNTFILVIITVPVSTGLALLVSLGLSSIEKLRSLFQTVYFLPYVTNTLAVGLVFMILFKKTAYTDGLVNVMLHWFGSPGVDFIDGPYWAKMFVLCFYTVWIVLPFCRPTVVTIVILKVIECWNSYVWPRLITDDENYFLVSNGIQAIRENGFGRENIPAMMAAVVVISVPLIVLFLLFRNKVMEGVSRGGTKG